MRGMPTSEPADFETKLPELSEVGDLGKGFESVKKERVNITLFGSGGLWRKNEAFLGQWL